MELYQIRYFLKVAETEHMTRAARELNLSEPTLSRTIRQLEEELETKLFERRGRSIVLTESGSILMSRASEVLKQMEGLQAEAEEFVGFIADQGADQCGFCNPGFVMNTIALLRENPDPTDDEIRAFLAGNLCRCSGYEGQLRGIRSFLNTRNAKREENA